MPSPRRRNTHDPELALRDASEMVVMAEESYQAALEYLEQDDYERQAAAVEMANRTLGMAEVYLTFAPGAKRYDILAPDLYERVTELADALTQLRSEFVRAASGAIESQGRRLHNRSPRRRTASEAIRHSKRTHQLRDDLTAF